MVKTTALEKHSVDIVSVFKMMPGSNVLVQPDTPRFTIVAASDDYLQATGRNRDELIGKGLFEAFPNNPEDAAQTSEKTVQASLEYVLAHKEPHHLPVQRYDVAGDGRYHERYWTAVNKPVFNNEGEVAFIIHSIEDVTARIKNQQHQVRESEEKYRQLFESMDQGFCVVEMIFDEENKPIDYRFLEINPVFEKQTGIKDATGKTVRELVPALESYWFELYGKVALTGEPMRFSQGSAALGRWFDVYAYRIGNSSSRKIALLFTDATERKRAEDAIRQSEQQVRALVESAPFPIGVYIGREMKITFVNQSIIDVWGKGADVVGKLYSEVLPELAGQRIYQQLDDVYTTGKPFHAKNQRVDLVVDGTLQPFYFNYSFTPLFDAEGKVYGVMNTAADVTDLNVAMQKVRQSEENFRSMILQAPVAMCILIGKDHVIDIANDAMINLWGKPQEHVMHKPVFEALPDAREQGLESLLDHVYETGESFSASERPVELVRQGKPEIVYQNFVYAPYRGADGNILGVLVISIDVTPQVLARKKIEEAEQKARLAIESADLGTYEFYIKTDEVAASPRFHDIWGIGNTSSRQQYANIIHPEDLPGRNEAITEAYRTGNLNYEARIITPENKLKWVKMRGVVLKDEQQEPERILGVVQDITEQKLFAEELRKRVEEQTAELLNAHKTLLSTNNYFRHIINKFDAALACLVPVFQDGKIADFYFKLTNTAYAVYANSTPEAIQNKLVSELFPGYYQTDVFDRYVTVFNTGEPQNWELHYNADGLNVFLLVAASKMNDEVVINFSDITELKNLQLDLLRKIEELERLNRNLEEFAYAASHDMKEPIRKIHVFIDMLKKSLTGKLSANEQGYFNRVETAARRMSTLIDDLLAYSEADHVTGHAETVNLNELIAQVLSDLDLEIEQRHAVVHVGDLSIVRGHRRQLQQAFQNLIGNALKYGKPHEPPVINITCSRTKGDQPGLHLTAEEQAKTYNRITIRDNGIGFEQAEAERIFNVFTRLHVKSEYKGTGIGLSIVRKVIQNHHGYIWAEAQPDAGASFHILLPADQ